MTYTKKQHHYINTFMQHIDVIVEQLKHLPADSLDIALERANRVVSTAVAGMNITTAVLGTAGVALALPTMGLSLSTAVAGITLIRSGNGVYQLVKQQFQSDEPQPLSPDELDAEERLLTLKILSREVACAAASVCYRHIIEAIASAQGVAQFARYGAARAMKIIYPSLDSQPPTAEVVLDYLCQSARRPQQTIAVEERCRSRSRFGRHYYAKWAYARPRAASFTLSSTGELEWVFYASAREALPWEERFFENTTLAKYGYAVLGETSLAAYVERQKAQPLTGASLDAVKPYLCAGYRVTRTEVEVYLNAFRSYHTALSFNDYLSERFHIRIIAECHDERLKGLDLRHGDFSGVNFRRANLEECLLENSRWTGAHLDEARFGGLSEPTLLTGAFFNAVTAERSCWVNVDFSGSEFSQSLMNGARLKSCRLFAVFPLNSMWEGVILEDMPRPDDFTQRLNEEAQARRRLEQEVSVLAKRLEESKSDEALTQGREEFVRLVTALQHQQPVSSMITLWDPQEVFPNAEEDDVSQSDNFSESTQWLPIEDTALLEGKSSEREEVNRISVADPSQLPFDNAEDYFNRGLAHGAVNRHEEAIADFSEAIRLKPDDAEAYYNRGFAYFKLNRHEEAIADYSEAIRLRPDFAEAYFGRGGVYFGVKRHEEAIADCSEAIRLRPDFAEAYNNRGVVYGDLNRHEEAIADFSEAIRLKPDFAEAYFGRGGVYFGVKRHEEAIADCSEAIRLKPYYAEAYFGRGWVYSEVNRHEEAIADFSEAIRLKPDYAEAYYNRGVVYGDLNRHEEAIADYSEAIRLKPDYAEAYNNRGVFYGRLNRHEEAIADFNEAIRLKPDHAEAYFNRGWVYSEVNRHEEAIADFSEAIRLRPDDAEAYFNRGLAYVKVNRHEEAIADFNEAIRLKPDHAEANNNRELAYKAFNRFKEAAEKETGSVGLDSTPSLGSHPSTIFAPVLEEGLPVHKENTQVNENSSRL